MTITMYKNAFDTTGSPVDMNEFLELIGLGEWEEDVKTIRESKDQKLIDSLKKRLPCVTFSGQFSQRGIEYCTEYNGMYVIDIDKLNKKRIAEIWSMLEHDEYVYSMFTSPSGNGLKIIFATTNTNPLLHSKMFQVVAYYFLTVYNITIDKSGSDISRLCFASYDPMVHYNSTFSRINLMSVNMPIQRSKNRYEHMVNVSAQSMIEKGMVETDIRRIYKVVRGWVESRGIHYRKGHRHNFLLNMACAMYRAGVRTDDIIRIIHRNHSIDQEMSKDLERIIKSINDDYSNQFNTKPIWARRNTPTLGLDLTGLT